MANEFTEIKIVGVDENLSYKDETDTRMTHVVLVLSASAPFEWADDFNGRWKQHFYMLKRNAFVSGNTMEVYCILDELQPLIIELKKVIAETNGVYRAYAEHNRLVAEQHAAEKARERAALSELNSKLKFD